MSFTDRELQLIIEALETEAIRLDVKYGRQDEDFQVLMDLIYKFKQQGE